jgi:hypothetical protein
MTTFHIQSLKHEIATSYPSTTRVVEVADARDLLGKSKLAQPIAMTTSTYGSELQRRDDKLPL